MVALATLPAMAAVVAKKRKKEQQVDNLHVTDSDKIL